MSTPLRLHAYYFGFTATGDEAIDRILSAVAEAGKGFHHTEGWTERIAPRPPFRGTSYAEWIQRAAEDAAKEKQRVEDRDGLAHHRRITPSQREPAAARSSLPAAVTTPNLRLQPLLQFRMSLEYLGTDLLTEQGPDGLDYWRICPTHVWASLPAATPDDTGRCPWCALDFDGGHHRGQLRHAELQQRLKAQG